MENSPSKDKSRDTSEEGGDSIRKSTQGTKTKWTKSSTIDLKNPKQLKLQMNMIWDEFERVNKNIQDNVMDKLFRCYGNNLDIESLQAWKIK